MLCRRRSCRGCWLDGLILHRLFAQCFFSSFVFFGSTNAFMILIKCIRVFITSCNNASFNCCPAAAWSEDCSTAHPIPFLCDDEFATIVVLKPVRQHCANAPSLQGAGLSLSRFSLANASRSIEINFRFPRWAQWHIPGCFIFQYECHLIHQAHTFNGYFSEFLFLTPMLRSCFPENISLRRGIAQHNRLIPLIHCRNSWCPAISGAVVAELWYWYWWGSWKSVRCHILQYTNRSPSHFGYRNAQRFT